MPVDCNGLTVTVPAPPLKDLLDPPNLVLFCVSARFSLIALPLEYTLPLDPGGGAATVWGFIPYDADVVELIILYKNIKSYLKGY
jgi:hypothetical protein